MLFFIVLAFLLIAAAILASLIIPVLYLERASDNKTLTLKKVEVSVAVSIFTLAVMITLLIKLIGAVSGNGCASDETKITKQVGKSTVTKCVPDNTLGFLFN